MFTSDPYEYHLLWESFEIGKLNWPDTFLFLLILFVYFFVLCMYVCIYIYIYNFFFFFTIIYFTISYHFFSLIICFHQLVNPSVGNYFTRNHIFDDWIIFLIIKCMIQRWRDHIESFSVSLSALLHFQIEKLLHTTLWKNEVSVTSLFPGCVLISSFAFVEV